MKFTEAQLEAAIIELLGEQGYPHLTGDQIVRAPTDVLIKEDLRNYLAAKYAKDHITEGEVESIVKQLETLPTSDLYESNKIFCKWLSDGFLLKREVVKGEPSASGKVQHQSKKDLYIQLIDYDDVVGGRNIYKIVNQLEIDSLSL
ncbi:MAG: type I restriction enzyme R subunit, partial [Oleiphilaceae bacterium]